VRPFETRGGGAFGHPNAIYRRQTAPSITIKTRSSMVLHLHHVPGRLRICLQKLEGNPRAIAPLHAELLSIPAVESASLNHHTGSVTIYYRRDAFEIKDFWARLHALGYLDHAPQAEPAAQSRMREAVVASAVSALGEALASAAIKHLINRSAWSLMKLLT
jgi:hypothetical protein